MEETPKVCRELEEVIFIRNRYDFVFMPTSPSEFEGRRNFVYQLKEKGRRGKRRKKKRGKR
jgi:hypothetical protein